MISSWRRENVPGYTLLELLIVVTLLAIAMGFALPSLGRFSQRGHLQDAVRQLRAELLTARLAAIESGKPAWFVFQPGSDEYIVTTESDDSRDQTAGNPLLDSSGELLDATAPLGDRQPQTLPAGVVFLADESSGNASRTGDGWSSPLIFYPNGRALNARIPLALEAYRVELTVRGLTGTVQISPIQRTAEPDNGETVLKTIDGGPRDEW